MSNERNSIDHDLPNLALSVADGGPCMEVACVGVTFFDLTALAALLAPGCPLVDE
jgi:hypothetical protein